ncbi:M91 family zinc metallopeptidase [Catellatospora sp. NPDC049609]|uniref:M91 family zinc metallopeptidase n=1 Tax=Catellatospora sp. NPDC049609 TaxID=3155505 RepID=UPI00342EBB01
MATKVRAEPIELTKGSDNPGVPNRERAAVGLPVDLDGDGTPEGPYREHPEGLTENALREEMGWPDRTVY